MTEYTKELWFLRYLHFAMTLSYLAALGFIVVPLTFGGSPDPITSLALLGFALIEGCQIKRSKTRLQWWEGKA
jgi:hypothetical protein